MIAVKQSTIQKTYLVVAPTLNFFMKEFRKFTKPMDQITIIPNTGIVLVSRVDVQITYRFCNDVIKMQGLSCDDVLFWGPPSQIKNLNELKTVAQSRRSYGDPR